MSLLGDLEVRRFYRVAINRHDEGRFLLKNGYNTAAVYLAGYSVECVLKSLMLAHEPASRHGATLSSFRGESAHSYEWLKEQLHVRGVNGGGVRDQRGKAKPDAALRRAFAAVNWWSTKLRYEPGTVRLKQAEAFLQSVNTILLWAKGRLGHG